ncbi:MAG: inositol monophosphatase [Deltaproteobacteria bacterium]|jgi:myo-inositol-1(or 4)-monophosphatase|nr:inositol monophosphatase [Deltaproteobacteria bacterium]
MERPENLLSVALEAAAAGSSYLLEGYGRTLEVRFKGAIDLVTQYDVGSENIVRKIISRSFPGHSILAEEGGMSGQQSAYRWYIDPLDGTTNFTRSHPFFAVSIACCLIVPGRPPRPLAGVVEAPVLRESFWAYEGGGAHHSQEIRGRGEIEERMKTTETCDPAEALINTGFPYDIANRPEQILSSMSRILPKVRAVRRAGAASLDLAYVACGRADGYWEYGIKPWDVAAGCLLISEAGGLFSELNGAPYILEKSETMLAGNRFIHGRLLSLLNG